jgi:plasmid stabilization system protein ParE
MARVRVTPRAEEDLQEIWLYIAPENADAADRILDRIGSRIEQTAQLTRAAGRRALAC